MSRSFMTFQYVQESTGRRVFSVVPILPKIALVESQEEQNQRRLHDLKVWARSEHLTATDLVCLPAGLFEAADLGVAERWAKALGEIFAKSGAVVVFGVDIATAGVWAPLAPQAESYLYAVRGETWLLWSAAKLNLKEVKTEALCRRMLVDDQTSLLLVLSCEIFSRSVRRRAEFLSPAVTVIMTHCGPTLRWDDTLGRWNQFSPLLIAGAVSKPKRPIWALAPRGYVEADLEAESESGLVSMCSI